MPNKIQRQLLWTIENLNMIKNRRIKNLIWTKTEFLGETLTSPFLFIDLGEESEERYWDTIFKFKNEMDEKNLPIDYRNSWGFRFPSIEFFNDIFSEKKYIKFYPGSFKGLTAIEALKVFNNL